MKTSVYGIVVHSNTESAISKRLGCRRFWTRALEKKANEERLNHEARNSIVGGKPKSSEFPAQNYCSDVTLHREHFKRLDNEDKLSRYKIVNTETNEEENLLTVALCNEKNRINELYFTAKSLERLAAEKGFKWMFITLTAPPKYHPNPIKGRRSYDHSVGVKGSHEYIKVLWTQIRAILNVRGVKASPEHYFGFRTVEPHKDGSFHWHLLIFANTDIQKKMTDAILEKFPGKNAAEIIYGKEGDGCASAATYLYKYIAKSVSREKINYQNTVDSTKDCLREEKDLASLRNKERVQASLKSMAIRQYQVFGVCNLTTIFKKINRLDLADLTAPQGSILEFVKSSIWRNTDGYLNMMKNADLFGSDTEIRLITVATLSSYGEPKKKVIGIRIGTVDFINHTTYKIVKS
ncbi:replication endonuclease [Pseudomonas sp. CCI1.2]|uniref:replication endonuclease n=1 Tax=Pseudomonas sp. CCI1.2 TaxID=3048614 RepID=UPI002B225B71|nr:replication endonuclease [Pseudomonas sp. CCI1.2]MEB0123974.1 replication endonuclease [Pseudomonas sp. CCI1.2]